MAFSCVFIVSGVGGEDKHEDLCFTFSALIWKNFHHFNESAAAALVLQTALSRTTFVKCK